ncbi:YetF domain-containing protein [Haloimpatiens lingqiaonensis]|uniref:YetF domain-containing protein n=1 Tax=Haloimpatiens lingqiaonensis TaxID=1380675 RepID=UPI0010FDD741|nr:DUF421 domain-containing protein [Haloimpatiens lingqiaonensis]
MFVLIFRTIILYFISILALRLMGKRQIGELQPFELVIAIMISELASMPMQDSRMPLINGIIPVLTLLIIQIIISVVQLKSEKVQKLICGKPSILIEDGKVNIQELRHQRINLNDLMEELRLNGYFNLQDIEYAILETSGQLSIIPNSQLTPVKKEDLGIQVPQEKLPITLILDGKINSENLNKANKTMDWLNNQIFKNNISSVEDVFIGLLDSKGNFYYQLKNSLESDK